MDIYNNGFFLFVHLVSTLASTISILLAWRIMNREAHQYVTRVEYLKLCAQVFKIAQSARSENVATLWDTYCEAEIAKAVANGEMPQEDELEEDEPGK
jgi:hypothetical protein